MNLGKSPINNNTTPLDEEVQMMVPLPCGQQCHANDLQAGQARNYLRSKKKRPGPTKYNQSLSKFDIAFFRRTFNELYLMLFFCFLFSVFELDTGVIMQKFYDERSRPLTLSNLSILSFVSSSLRSFISRVLVFIFHTHFRREALLHSFLFGDYTPGGFSQTISGFCTVHAVEQD